MRKRIKSIMIENNNALFTSAELYIGYHQGPTYILCLENPRNLNLNHGFQNGEIHIVTDDEISKTLIGTLDSYNQDEAIFYIAGEPFPITEQEFRSFM